MSDFSRGEGWWVASDGKWYPPEQHPSRQAPPPPMAPPAPWPATGATGWGPPMGPIGKRENIGIQVLLSFVTCGLYGIYWAYKSHDEIQRHTGEGVGGLVGVLIYVFVGVVTLFLLPLEIKRMYERDGRHSPVSGATAFWILLFGIPWYVKCQDALNQYWTAKGAPPP